MAASLDDVEANEFGRNLKGLGLNLLVRDVLEQVDFLTTVFGMSAYQSSKDFAIVTYGDHLFQLHSDATYHSNPLLNLLPENAPRGAGIEIRLFDTNPDQAITKAREYGATILQEASDKPHGLREAYILCANGYAWVPSRPL